MLGTNPFLFARSIIDSSVLCHVLGPRTHLKGAKPVEISSLHVLCFACVFIIEKMIFINPVLYESLAMKVHIIFVHQLNLINSFGTWLQVVISVQKKFDIHLQNIFLKF